MTFQLGEWTVHPDRNELASRSETRRIEPKAMELLLRLAATPGVVVTKEELLRDVWKDTHVVEHVLAKTVSALRKALGDDAQESRFISTVPRRGYMLKQTIPLPPQRERVPKAGEGTTRRLAAVAASIAVALLTGLLLRRDARHSVTVLPTRGSNQALAHDAEDALVHDLTKFSCLSVSKSGAADYRIESNVIRGGATLRTRLVDGKQYVAAIDTPAAGDVVAASKSATATLVKHVCRKR